MKAIDFEVVDVLQLLAGRVARGEQRCLLDGLADIRLERGLDAACDRVRTMVVAGMHGVESLSLSQVFYWDALDRYPHNAGNPFDAESLGAPPRLTTLCTLAWLEKMEHDLFASFYPPAWGRSPIGW